MKAQLGKPTLIGQVGGLDGAAQAKNGSVLAQLDDLGAMDTGALGVGRDLKQRDAAMGIAQALLHHRDDAVKSVLKGLSEP